MRVRDLSGTLFRPAQLRGENVYATRAQLGNSRFDSERLNLNSDFQVPCEIGTYINIELRAPVRKPTGRADSSRADKRPPRHDIIVSIGAGRAGLQYNQRRDRRQGPGESDHRMSPFQDAFD